MSRPCVVPREMNRGVFMNTVIKAIAPDTPASKTIIAPGDALRKINGSAVEDILDYMYLSYDERLLLELTGGDGKIKLVKLRKPEGVDPGLEFEEFLMDKQRSCANKCIFCFVDQLPGGMRETLYYKDDDVRLSFLHGNYITLTNLSSRDIARIIKYRISPLNVSVHTLDRKLRAFMLGKEYDGGGIDAQMALLAGAGIRLNCQIVCCPGINDGVELSKTMKGLAELGPSINSVSVAPVGLTKYRQGLTPLRPFDRAGALRTVLQVERFGELCLKSRGSRVFFSADEFYIKAGLELPPHIFYEGYPQLENGVGMMRLFITQFLHALKKPGQPEADGKPFSVATGAAAGKYLTNLLNIAVRKHGTMKGGVYTIRNIFFGDSVTVSGLLTGRDIISQLKNRDLGSRLLLPQNMLRRGEDVFLDDMTVKDVSDSLGLPIRIVRQDGADLLRAFLGVRGE